MRADGLWPRPRRVQTPDGGPLVVGAGARFAIEAKPDPGRPGEQSAAEEIEFAAAAWRRVLEDFGGRAMSARVLAALARRRGGEGSAAEAKGRAGGAFGSRTAGAGNRETVPVSLVLDRSSGRGESRSGACERERYRLRVDHRGITVRAAKPIGLFHAASTLRQWLNAAKRRTGNGATIPPVEIDDWPNFPVRGAMLDVSRNRVPTMACLRRLIGRLAGWKVNHLQLYVEHTYAYKDHEEVWRNSSPLTARDIRSLDAYCRERFIELAPNQNSFGHFHRWLVHGRYRPLAEVPEGIRHPFSPDPEPFSLCATDPRVVSLLSELYEEVLPQFTSRRFNVGLDETFDLGQGRSADACRQHGRAAVYLDFLRRVHRLVRKHGRQTLFWADIILEQPELIDQVPKDAAALCWGYEANHPFADQCARLATSEREFWACPGTSTWNSFGGRLRNAVLNLANAAVAGEAAGAQGFLITDWGDWGHLQPPLIAELPLSIGAGFAWTVQSARDVQTDVAAPSGTALRDAESSWIEFASRFVFDGDEELARTVVELGTIDRFAGGPVMNGTTLFYLLRFLHEDLTHRRYRNLSIAKLQQTWARLAAIRSRLESEAARTGAVRQVSRSRNSLVWTCRLMMWCCRLGIARLSAGRTVLVGSLPPAVRTALADEVIQIANDLRPVWTTTSREGGLEESRSLLLRAAARIAGSGASRDNHSNDPH